MCKVNEHFVWRSVRRRLSTSAMIFFVWMLWTAFDQHYGGLEETERMMKQTPNWEQAIPREFLERIAKRRVFGTLVYPNALAGAILLLFPVSLVLAFNSTKRLRPVIRPIVIALTLFLGVAGFFWTGSKVGWLVAIALGGVCLFRL